MIAVANASPICYLVLIGEIELLPKLFREVLVPRPVIEELLAEGAPTVVRSWASTPPAWVRIHETPASAAPHLERLHSGERAAIVLACSMRAEVVLLDEKAARRGAAEQGLSVAGVLAVLAQAANLDLVDLPAALDRLTRTSFRCSPTLLKSMLDRYAGR